MLILVFHYKLIPKDKGCRALPLTPGGVDEERPHPYPGLWWCGGRGTIPSPGPVWGRASGSPTLFKGPRWEVQGVPIPFPMDGGRPGARDPYPFLRP